MALSHWGIRSIHTSHCSVDNMCCSWDMCLSCQDTGGWEDYLERPQGGGSVKQQPNNQQQEQQGHIVWSVHYTCSREDNTFHDQGSRQPMEAGKWWAKSQNAMVGIELRNTIAEEQACFKNWRQFCTNTLKSYFGHSQIFIYYLFHIIWMIAQNACIIPKFVLKDVAKSCSNHCGTTK